MTDSDRVTVPEGHWQIDTVRGMPVWEDDAGCFTAAELAHCAPSRQYRAEDALRALIERAEAADRPVPDGAAGMLGRGMRALRAWSGPQSGNEFRSMRDAALREWDAAGKPEGDVSLPTMTGAELASHYDAGDNVQIGMRGAIHGGIVWVRPSPEFVEAVRARSAYVVARIVAPPEPATEGVPWWEAVGRKTRDGAEITAVGRNAPGAWYKVRAGSTLGESVDPSSGLIACLVDGDKP